MVNATFPAIRTGYAEPKEKAPGGAEMDTCRDADTARRHPDWSVAQLKQDILFGLSTP